MRRKKGSKKSCSRSPQIPKASTLRKPRGGSSRPQQKNITLKYPLLGEGYPQAQNWNMQTQRPSKAHLKTASDFHFHKRLAMAAELEVAAFRFILHHFYFSVSPLFSNLPLHLRAGDIWRAERRLRAVICQENFVKQNFRTLPQGRNLFNLHRFPFGCAVLLTSCFYNRKWLHIFMKLYDKAIIKKIKHAGTTRACVVE